MKKFFLTLLTAISMGSFVLSAQTVSNNGDGKFCLVSDDVTMTVDASKGGKIMSFRYNDNEVLSQTQIPNSFGSTFWTSPQSEWNWPPVPEYDSQPYMSEIKDGSLILTGQKSERFGYRVRKQFTLDPKDDSFVITYTIINESGEVRKVAPWEISRVPNGGIIFFDADEVLPANRMRGLPFTYEKGAAWYVLDETRGHRKTNADGEGWLAFYNNGLLFVKKFQDLTPEEPAPAEAEIQIYVNTGKTFVEIEEQGAYTELQPGEELNWTVRWYLIPADHDIAPSKALLKAVKKVL